MTTVSAGNLATSCATAGRRFRGIERMTTSTSSTASAAETARAPEASTSASIVSGPRELATFTSCPAAPSLSANVFPMWPTPRMPIFTRASPSGVSVRGRIGLARKRQREAVQRVTKGGQLVVREPARRLDLLGHGARLLAEGLARLGEVDEDATLVGRVPRAGHQPGSFQPLEKRRQRPVVHAQDAAEVADAPRGVLVEGEHDQELGVGQAERLQERPVEPDDSVRGAVQREGELPPDASPLLVLGRWGTSPFAGHAVLLSFAIVSLTA